MDFDVATELVEALNKHNELIREQIDLLKDIKYELTQIRGNM